MRTAVHGMPRIGGTGERVLFAGVVDGRNVWMNHLDASLGLPERLGPTLPRSWRPPPARCCTCR